MVTQISPNSPMGKFLIQHIDNKKAESIEEFFKIHLASWNGDTAVCAVVNCSATFVDEDYNPNECLGCFTTECDGC